MQAETNNCQNCKKDFTIEPADFSFYEKIQVPPPTFCWTCRLQRRLSIRNERSLYKRICALCNKETISIYSPDKDLTVYCVDCYKSDNWDPFSYGRDYDFNRSLFEQVDRLFREVPRPALNLTNAIDCEYSEDCVNAKNCYLVFGAFHADNMMYSYTPIFSRNCIDVTFTNQVEMSYEVSNAYGLYNVTFAHVTNECLDSAFLYDCVGSKNCFGCINLRNKKHYIFNKPYSKKEYEEEMKKWDIGSYKTLQKAKQKFQELYDVTPRRWAITSNAVNVSGNNIANAKNCHYCFSITEGCENLKFTTIAGLAMKDSYDVWGGGDKSQLLYEVTGCIGGERVFFTNNTHGCVDVQYSNKCFNCQNLFACAGLKKKNYCILNKPYSKEEYRQLLAKIIEQAKKVPFVDRRGREYRYGEFFPIEHMPVAYNESNAYERFPMTKEEVLKEAYAWHDEPERHYGITMQSVDMPDHVNDATNEITKEIIACEHAGKCTDHCTTAFRITPRELEFYRQLRVALPRLCPNCRHGERERRRNGMFELHDRACQCAGKTSENNKFQNTTEHFHGADHCPNTFKSAFSPERKEIMYCEACYQNELI